MSGILVTGAAGFIGSHLVDALLLEGHKVIGVDNLSLGRKENLSLAFSKEKFSFHVLDLVHDVTALQKIFKEEKLDTVFHLAANSDISISFTDPSVDLQNTFMSTYNVLDCMRKFGVKNLVFSSTSAIYGNSKGVLVHEDYAPLFPISHYGAAKLSSEAFISSFSHNYNIRSWICRFPNVVGSRGTHGVIVDFIKKLKKNPEILEVLGDGEQNKPYLYVTDLVEAMIFVWNNASNPLNYFNLGVSSRTRVKEIVSMLLTQAYSKAKIHYGGGNIGWVGDVPEFQYDLTKIKTLGWEAKYSSNEAVNKAIEDLLKEN